MIHTFSASQIKNFRRCHRKWGIEKIDKIKQPDSPVFAHGKTLHTKWEKYVRDGEYVGNDLLGKIAAQIIRKDWIPIPGSPGLHVEEEFHLATPFPDINLLGYIDLICDPEKLVIDYKTTSDLRWAMTEEDLRHDVQAVIYAKYAAYRFQDPKVRCRWLYAAGRDRPKGAKKVEIEFDTASEEFNADWLGILEDLQVMRDSRNACKKGDGVALPPNVESCDTFGGCPYRGEPCKLSMGDYMVAHAAMAEIKNHREARFALERNQDPMSFMSKLKEMEEKHASTEPEAPKKKRGRPPKKKAEDMIEAGAETSVNPPENPKPKEGIETTVSGGDLNPPKPANGAIDFLVMFDALPESMTQFRSLASFMQPVIDELNSELGQDWRLVDYAEGRKKLAVKFDRWLAKQDHPGIIVADSATEECVAVKDILRRRAGFVIRGTR